MGTLNVASGARTIWLPCSGTERARPAHPMRSHLRQANGGIMPSYCPEIAFKDKQGYVLVLDAVVSYDPVALDCIGSFGCLGCRRRLGDRPGEILSADSG